MTPVFKLPRPDDDEPYEGDDVDADKGDEPGPGKVVGFGEPPGVGPAPVVELETPINAPGPISGLSKKNCRCQASETKYGRGR